MNKIEMYKEVPQRFHNTLCDTLEQLEEEKVVRFSAKRFAITCAAVVLAASTLTVGAMELFRWYQTARESLGTNQELENKLTNQGAALPAEDVDVQQDITMTALQAVKTDEDFYLLAAMDWPEDLEWNGDIVFGECEIQLSQEAGDNTVIQEGAGSAGMQEAGGSIENVPSAQEFGGLTANFAGAPDESRTVFVEIIARGYSDVEYAGEAKVTLINLIQTEKTDYVETLVAAEWELTFNLPTDADTRSFKALQPLSANRHNLVLDNVEINPFGVKLYTDEEQGRHATYYSNIELAAVLYEDGSRVENYGALLQRSAATNDAGNFYFNLALQNAVDIDKVSGLVFKEDGEEFVYALGENAVKQAGTVGSDFVAENAETISLHSLMIQQATMNSEGSAQVTDLRILYARHNYPILTDGKYIYHWDAACNHAEIIANLADCGFDAAKGGDIAMMPGGVVLAVHPTADSDKVYMIEMDTFDMYDADAESIWPVPRYEDYRNSFFQVSERTNLAEGVYAPEGYEAQGIAYALYSADGSVEKMELVDLNK